MREARFTPGPWEYVTGPSLNGRYHTVQANAGAENEVVICECYEDIETRQAANAQAIAALPNLYEALRLITELDGDQPARTAWNMVHLARAALAKVSSGTPQADQSRADSRGGNGP
jgi:hypothetical protein